MKKAKVVIAVMVFVFVMTISVGFAALNSELSISGDAVIRVDKNIRITNIKFLNSSNGGEEKYNPKYSERMTASYVYLPNKNSSVTYEVEVTNTTGGKIQVNNILESINNNISITYQINGLENYDVLEGEKIRFTITMTNTSEEEQEGALILLYDLSPFTPPTAPVLMGGSDDWISENGNINIEVPGTAFTGVKEYEYYITTDENDIPDVDSTPTDVTQNNVLVAEDGTYYVYYRTVANNDYKSEWTSAQVLKIDRITPTVVMLPSGNKLIDETEEVLLDYEFGPSGGTYECINVQTGDVITDIASINGLGDYDVTCTVTSNAGLSASQTENYWIDGEILPLISIKNNVSDTSDGVNVRSNGTLYGPYSNIRKGCYFVNYTGTSLSYNNAFEAYINSPKVEFDLLQKSYDRFGSIYYNYYIYVDDDYYLADGYSGIEFYFHNKSLLVSSKVTSITVTYFPGDMCPPANAISMDE